MLISSCRCLICRLFIQEVGSALTLVENESPEFVRFWSTPSPKISMVVSISRLAGGVIAARNLKNLQSDNPDEKPKTFEN